MKTYKNITLKIICLLLFIVSFGISQLHAIQRASIVMCAESGSIHHEQNADAITHPASLTKMMTLYLTFKALRENRISLDQKLPVSKHASQQAPCKLWLKPGTTITVKQAILGMVTKSANDAAAVIAEALGSGSEERFAQMMTKQARALGMSKTVFKNASGLPNKSQVTTARDMATLSQSLYKHFPREFAFFKEQTFIFRGQKLHNHNHLLGKVQGLDGIKTGFVNASGFNLAASVVRDNKRIIAVVMGGESARSRDKKMVQLLEATYKHTMKDRKSPQNPGKYASIGDLIHTLGPSPVNPTPIKEAKYYTSDGQINALDNDVDNLDSLISVIDDASPKPKLIKAKSSKGSHHKSHKHHKTHKHHKYHKHHQSTKSKHMKHHHNKKHPKTHVKPTKKSNTKHRKKARAI